MEESQTKLQSTDGVPLHQEGDLDSMDRVPLPRLNPWLALCLLILIGFLYIWAFTALLGFPARMNNPG